MREQRLENYQPNYRTVSSCDPAISRTSSKQQIDELKNFYLSQENQKSKALAKSSQSPRIIQLDNAEIPKGCSMLQFLNVLRKQSCKSQQYMKMHQQLYQQAFEKEKTFQLGEMAKQTEQLLQKTYSTIYIGNRGGQIGRMSKRVRMQSKVNGYYPQQFMPFSENDEENIITKYFRPKWLKDKLREEQLYNTNGIKYQYNKIEYNTKPKLSKKIIFPTFNASNQKSLYLPWQGFPQQSLVSSQTKLKEKLALAKQFAETDSVFNKNLNFINKSVGKRDSYRKLETLGKINIRLRSQESALTKPQFQ